MSDRSPAKASLHAKPPSADNLTSHPTGNRRITLHRLTKPLTTRLSVSPWDRIEKMTTR
jgi:hypothetical protein